MRKWMILAIALLACAMPAFAAHDRGKTTFGGEIVVADDETSGDIACVFCRVVVHGKVKGDVAVAFGSLSVDDARGISGDVAVFASNLYMGRGSWIDGDLALAAGDATISEGAVVKGSRSMLTGKAWLLVALLPVVVLIGIVWLIVWLVRRNRYQFPAYPPPGRRP